MPLGENAHILWMERNKTESSVQRFLVLFKCLSAI